MSEPTTRSQEPLGAAAYLLAALAFIPGLGILLGLPSIGWGLLLGARGGRKVVAIAAAGVTLNVLGYAALFYVGVAKKGLFANLESQMAHQDLRKAVLEIEFWRVQHGAYPDSLAQLIPNAADARLAPLYDHSVPPRGGKAPYFFYQRTPEGTHYWLRGRGPDEQPFTADDILPQLPDPERAKTGLLLAR
jgi:hypothetical protein